MTTIKNPDLIGPVSPTPPTVYEPRIWRARIWLTNGPFEGIPVVWKCPYGQAMNAATVLARACSRWQIQRFTFGPMPARQIAKLDRRTLTRFEPAFEAFARKWAIDFSA